MVKELLTFVDSGVFDVGPVDGGDYGGREDGHDYRSEI
jgi:hypothetical protein